MEWQVLIPVGKGHMKVNFTGGTLLGMGSAPAIYTTANPVVQTIIENSGYFQSGRIYLQRVQRTDEPDAAEAAEVEQQTVSKTQDNTTENTNTETEENPEVVEVSDKVEAVEYLKEHYNSNYSATQLRTKTAFEAACAECGVKFKFTD